MTFTFGTLPIINFAFAQQQLVGAICGLSFLLYFILFVVVAGIQSTTVSNLVSYFVVLEERELGHSLGLNL
jgi:hypothetical protein